MYAHGNSELMSAFEGSGRTYLTRTIIQGYDLSQLKVAVFYGCKTAQTPTSGINVTDAAVAAGAGAAIGFSEDVFLSAGTTTGPAYVWSKHFWALMAEGNGIEKAAEDASEEFRKEKGGYSGVDKFVISGNTGQTIVPAEYK